MQLRFLGGAGTVTGSKLLVEHRSRRLLLDCGLFQGVKQLRLHNRTSLGVPSRSIDAVVLTQAHAAHSAFAPRLIALGFKGPVYASAATVQLCQLLWPAAGRRFEEEARLANALGYSKHLPALPLYTEDQAHQALERLQPCAFDDDFEPAPGFALRLRPAGQALGAAQLHLRCGTHGLLYVSTLGRSGDPLLRAPVPPEATEVLLVASTYGRRAHRWPDALLRLSRLVVRTAARGGVLLLPADAAGGAQRLLQALHLLKSAGRIPELPVWLDDRIATEVLSVYGSHPDESRLDAPACQTLLQGVHVAQSDAEALMLADMPGPGILIAIEGVACGRALAQHLKRLAPQARHAIAYSSYQPAGTRAAALLAGEARIKVQGEWVPVQAEVQALDGLSGHADRQSLLDWILASPRAPQQVYLMQGEPEAADSLRQAIAERRPWPCSVPEYQELAHWGEAETAQRGCENSSKAATALAAYISDGPPPM